MLRSAADLDHGLGKQTVLRTSSVQDPSYIDLPVFMLEFWMLVCKKCWLSCSVTRPDKVMEEVNEERSKES